MADYMTVEETKESEHALVSDRCKKCKYCGNYKTKASVFSRSVTGICCDYILMEGHSRGCEAGNNCTRFVKATAFTKKKKQKGW